MDDLTALIAFYGALLATLSFVLSVILAINELLKQRPKLKVSLSHANLHARVGQSEPMISAEIANFGNTPVNLSSCGWLLTNKTQEILINHYPEALPHELKPGRRFNVLIACRWFREGESVNQRAFFFYRDELGRSWKTKLSKKLRQEWVRIPLNGWKILFDPVSLMYFEEYMAPPDIRGRLR